MSCDQHYSLVISKFSNCFGFTIRRNQRLDTEVKIILQVIEAKMNSTRTMLISQSYKQYLVHYNACLIHILQVRHLDLFDVE